MDERPLPSPLNAIPSRYGLCLPLSTAALSGGAQIIDMMALVIDANKAGVTVESVSALLIATKET